MGEIYPSGCKTDPVLGDCFYQYDDPGKSDLYFGRKVLAVSYGGTLQLFGKKGSTFDGLDPTPSSTGKSWTRLITNLKPWARQPSRSPGKWTGRRRSHRNQPDRLPAGPCGRGESSPTLSTIGSRYHQPSRSAESFWTTERFRREACASRTMERPIPIPADIKTKLELDRDVVDTRAAVALLSRSIRIVSEGNTGPDTSQRHRSLFPA